MEDGARSALGTTLDSRVGKRLVVFCDSVQRGLGDVFAGAALDLGLWVGLVALEASDETGREMVRP